jgi:hypothetical protein
MLLTEIIRRDIHETHRVELTDLEVDHLRRLLDDWATDDEILNPDLYAELRDEVSRIMSVSHAEAFAISGCLENDYAGSDLHQKFASIRQVSRSDPCWRS